ncbi:MAG: XrtA/PEP-CTERM system histidine kinase PrsK, partial [Caldimonas sp.]
MNLAIYGYGLAALLHTALAFSLIHGLAPRRQRATAAPLAFLGAVCSTALWGWTAVAATLADTSIAAAAASLFDLLRYGLWIGCLLILLRPVRPNSSPTPGWLAILAAMLVGLALIVWLAWASGAIPSDANARPAFSLALALPVLGLVLVEQLYRNATDDSRWSSKPFCLALALTFVFDIYFYSQAALFGHFDADAVDIRGVVHAVCVPLLWVASKRQANALGALRVSRAAAFHTAALLLVGLYLLFLSAIGYYVRQSGGDWGSALQIGLLFVGSAGLIFILLSGSARASLRVFIGKHFFAYRYDYRAEWLRFTAMLSGAAAPRDVGVLVIRGLADMVESPAGALWSTGLGGSEFVQTSRWNMAQTADRESADSPLCTLLRTKSWIVDLAEARARPERYGALSLPAWLASLQSAWLIVPLQVDDDLLGFVVLAQARTTVQINWEVRDLLKTASRQAAGFLA